MSKAGSSEAFRRPQGEVLAARLAEPRRFLQVVAGARQVGKTTLVLQVLDGLAIPHLYVSADGPAPGEPAWLQAQWERARILASTGRRAVLALDEIQKIRGWSETVKALWDEDSRARRRLKVVVLGSAPLLVQGGLAESLAGRFEVLHLPHWSYPEMHSAFGFSLDDYLYFGGYPGGAPLASDPARWRRYLLDALVETTLARDVLLMTRVDKPALLRQLFQLGCRYSGQVVSFTKLLGQLQDAGNTVTLAHYLQLLAGAGMLTGLARYSGSTVRQRGSIPKLQALNTALVSVQFGASRDEAIADRDLRGRLVESAVGAHLANQAAAGECELFYWREGAREVDFVVRRGRALAAIEVKSGRARDGVPGLGAFTRLFAGARPLLVGGDGIPLDEFLARPAGQWLAPA